MSLTSTQSESIPLTVDRKWKVDEELADRETKDDKPSNLIPAAKWIAMILLGGSILCLFIASKISFISLSMELSIRQPDKGPDTDNIEEWVGYTSQFLVIYLMLAVPYTLLLARAAWMGICTRKSPWPKKSAVICCIIVGILEPNGLVLLSLKVLPRYSPILGAQIMGTTLTLTVLLATAKAVRHEQTSLMAKVLMLLASFFMLGGLGLVIKQLLDLPFDTDIWHVVACLISLNIAWLPWIHKQMKKSKDILEHKTEDKGQYRSNSVSRLSTPFLQSSSSGTDSFPNESTTNGHIGHQLKNLPSPLKKTHAKKATWKASFLLYLIKCITTTVLAFIYFYLDVSHDVKDSFSNSMQTAFLRSWNFQSSLRDPTTTWTFFTVNLVTSLVCYVLVFIVLHTNIQRFGLAVPSLLSLSLVQFIMWQDNVCQTFIGHSNLCQQPKGQDIWIWPAILLLTMGQFLALGRMFLINEKIYLLKESELFWIPGYNGAVLDSYIMSNIRRTISDVYTMRWSDSKTKTKVYICTTMYREDESEMRQILESLHRINLAQAEGERFFESHILFDGGVNNRKLSDFALILVSLLEDTLGINPTTCTKIITPYGMKLSWALPGKRGSRVMTFNIHLKDNKLVKNKKRWSQVMYMSYVLDFLSDAGNPDEDCYILTTDADVMFTPHSVEALLDLMSRDNTVGAVCARTHPTGSGPLVWYQMFEYAVGHWFQKAAEHVLGSVLCAPGCFSVYRCRALRDILPKYSKKVESAFEFLTKDMGEDRWLCTLMVQSGWRIEYCAASENFTNCPAEFEEFYKQRRRWIASTLANLILIIKEWKFINLFNHRVSIVFLFYQVLLLFSTLIGPSTVILIVSGGLDYAWGFDGVAGLMIQIVFCLLYTLVCVYASSKSQMLWAKVYTFIYAMLMCAVAVGIAQQVVSDINPKDPEINPYINSSTTVGPKRPSQHISIDIPISITTIYLGFLVSLFLLTGLLHPREIQYLAHGLWYLLCLPSAYLVLMIYSICNLTDSSWGTREGKVQSNAVKKENWWTSTFQSYFYSIVFCCKPPSTNNNGMNVDSQTTRNLVRQSSVVSEDLIGSQGNMDSMEITQRVSTSSSSFNVAQNIDDVNNSVHLEMEEEDLPVLLEDWLPHEFKAKYLDIFKRHGFESTLFITALTEIELNRMGITTRGHVQYLMSEISSLPKFEIEYKVPTNVPDWLNEIGLPMYRDNFRRNHIRTPKEMEILKRFDRKDIEKELGIKKEGHIKRLMYAIRMLRDPSEMQQKALRMRAAIEESPVHYLHELHVAENDFWNKLKGICLEPDLKAFGMEAEIKDKLLELRNNWLIVMAVTNTLWLILISTLASKGDLTVLGANAIGLAFLFVFGLLFTIQFLAMLVHRTATLAHYIAMAPYKFGKPMHSNWSFTKRKFDSVEDSLDADAIRQIKVDAERALKRVAKGTRRSQGATERMSERTHLLA